MFVTSKKTSLYTLKFSFNQLSRFIWSFLEAMAASLMLKAKGVVANTDDRICHGKMDKFTCIKKNTASRTSKINKNLIIWEMYVMHASKHAWTNLKSSKHEFQKQIILIPTSVDPLSEINDILSVHNIKLAVSKSFKHFSKIKHQFPADQYICQKIKLKY